MIFNVIFVIFDVFYVACYIQIIDCHEIIIILNILHN